MKKFLILAALILPVGLVSAQSSGVLIKKGKKIYDGIGACASCHGPKGLGDGPAAAALNPKPRSFADGVFQYDTDKDGTPGTDTDLKNILTKGTIAYGGSPLMPPRPDIKGADLDALIAYVRSLKTKKD